MIIRHHMLLFTLSVSRRLIKLSKRMSSIYGIEVSDCFSLFDSFARQGSCHVGERLEQLGKKQDDKIIEFQLIFPVQGSPLENMERRKLIANLLRDPQEGSATNDVESIYSVFALVGDSSTTAQRNLSLTVCPDSNVAFKSLLSYTKGIGVKKTGKNCGRGFLLADVLRKRLDEENCPFELYNAQLSNDTVLKIDSHSDYDKHEGIEARTDGDCIHPVFFDDRNVPVFHSYDQALDVLNQCRELTVVSELLERVARIPLLGNESSSMQAPQHPFIVLEGMDGSGKSTLTRNLARKLNAVSLQTPPDPIKDLRQIFDSYPEILRRAYYSVGNYIAQKLVLEICRTQPVILDRFWHSTTAYGLANECSCGEGQHLPPGSRHIYQWPQDLLQPSAILFTFVPEEERNSRLITRSQVITDEEKILAQSSRFRKRLLNAYRKIHCDVWIEVDTSGTEEESLQKAMDGLKGHKIIATVP